MLAVENLETSFFTKHGALKAVDSVSFHVEAGKTVGIVGESGCGKSVTSLSIMGLLEHPGAVTGGKILFKGVDLLKLPESELTEIRGNKIAMIFQEPMTAINPSLTIGYQIDEQILRHKKCSKKEARERSIEMLALVGVPSPEQRYKCYAHQLSGGMRQRAMIAMALSCDPELLIADEPTTALDVTVQAQILELIQNLQQKLNMGVQFITHDLGVISEVADTVVVMYAGSICEVAPAAQLFSNPRHPYTVALMESIPKSGQRVEMLNTIPGNVPSLANRPRGCAFQNRCSKATETCKTEKPLLSQISQLHSVACFQVGAYT